MFQGGRQIPQHFSRYLPSNLGAQESECWGGSFLRVKSNDREEDSKQPGVSTLVRVVDSSRN